ncbi:hypothetical protein MANES_10G047933v8 [Manihot esculenta]|uniref:Uncharacterized protein n=1 Tax=Manihot esculenta TaxID=3983 RepID=A0ACB7GZ88_MANES|nr:hypothetical protein MANES_10G047933v8 [Manihot esculenta]
MKSLFALVVPLFLLLSILSSINARKDLDEYWKGVTKDQPVPEAMQKLLQASDEKTNCHTTKTLEPNADLKIYHNDDFLKEGKSSFLQQFEPRPDVSIYHNDIGLKTRISLEYH